MGEKENNNERFYAICSVHFSETMNQVRIEQNVLFSKERKLLRRMCFKLNGLFFFSICSFLVVGH